MISCGILLPAGDITQLKSAVVSGAVERLLYNRSDEEPTTRTVDLHITHSLQLNFVDSKAEHQIVTICITVLAECTRGDELLLMEFNVVNIELAIAVHPEHQIVTICITVLAECTRGEELLLMEFNVVNIELAIAVHLVFFIANYKLLEFSFAVDKKQSYSISSERVRRGQPDKTRAMDRRPIDETVPRQSVHRELRVDIDNTGWTGMPSPRRVATAPNSPSTSFRTDREAVFRSGNATVVETHIIRSTGMQSNSFTEEHWSSEIKSFVAVAPPKFIQVIKAYRVLSSDTLTLVVEVVSDPPAIFEWFCNDKPVQQFLQTAYFMPTNTCDTCERYIQRPDDNIYQSMVGIPIANCSPLQNIGSENELSTVENGKEGEFRP
ncbi:hypothetical protein DICVIV_12137 [Dictyocaulus viviparus]|uniref:Ig-like domain-containing protein n=1 Tax=Dictyocaulus viviparus TaxID=29172 RepID=A0A0D8XB95_DICVI|nr:hypothetical protein DICVIV_12137 [Dictyocaulus viviparus]